MIDRDKLYQARTEWIEQQKAKSRKHGQGILRNMISNF
jgi:hypothetical protein